MARKAGGKDKLEAAKVQLKKARTADELRSAQAVVLPLMFGLNLEQTAAAIGRSVGRTSTMRTQFMGKVNGKKEVIRSKRELRNRANVSFESEAQILKEVMRQAVKDGVVVIPPLKPKVDARLGKIIALTTLYSMLARHGWKKVAPAKARRKGQVQWKQLPK